jgi:hypothetical protein
MSGQLIQFIRAFLFGATVSVAFVYFFLYFKPIVEEVIGGNPIPLDLWWWGGLVFSIVAGILVFIVMI